MTDMNTQAPQRPTFLTVLCILSFIAGGWALISGAMSLASSPDPAELQARMDEAMSGLEGLEDNPMAGFAQQMAEEAGKAAAAARPLSMASVALALVGLFGVWQMWNLKKVGFWIYTAAGLAGLVAPLVIMGGGMLALLSVGVGGFFTLLFIVLYALNLKHMR